MEAEFGFLLIILLIGATIVLTILLKACLELVRIPALIGYLLLGFLVKLADVQGLLLSEVVRSVYGVLGELGIICLLFRVGLESNLAGLARQLPRACLLLIGNLVFSSSLSFVAAYYFLQLPLIPSLFISMALTATSVGISVSVWQEAKALNSDNGELLLIFPKWTTLQRSL